MATDSRPGDVLIPKVELQGEGGNLRLLAENIQKANIYENMMSLGTFLKFTIMDTNDALGNLNLRKGVWKGKFHFNAPGSTIKKLDDLRLESIKKVQDMGSNGSKGYELTLYSAPLLTNLSKLIQKKYNKSIGNIVKDVGKEIGITKWEEFEDTKGVQEYWASNFNGDYILHQLNRRAVSNNSKSSLYFTFANYKDGKEVYNFVTLEKLFKQESFRKMIHENAGGSNLRYDEENDGRIINYVYPKANSLSQLIMGSRKQESRESAPGNHRNEKKDSTKKDTDYTSGGNKTKIGDMSEYNRNIGTAHTIPSDKSYLPDDYLTKAFPDKQSYLSFVTDNCLNIQVYGDSQYTAGKILDIKINRNEGTTGPQEPDPQLNGKMIIVGVNHEIRGNRTSPRYICHMDCLKGSHQK